MKRIFQILAVILGMFAFQNAYAAHQLYADIDGVNIPYGTKFELSLAQDVTSSNVMQGDMFEAYLVRDLYVNRKLILPL